MSIAIAIAISSGHVLAVAMTVGLAVFFTLAVWFTSVRPAFVLSGDEVSGRL